MKKLNPSYNQRANEHIEEFTYIAHVPALPPALPNFEDSVYFCKKDAKFYHCVKIDDKWMWERVTYGTSRNYVLPIKKIIPQTHKDGDTTITDYNFNDMTDAIKQIIVELHRYDDDFDPMVEGVGGITPKVAVAKYNEIASYINRINHTELEIFDVEATADTVGGMAEPGYLGVTLSQFNTELNKLIDELNPHADASEADARITRLENVLDGVPSGGNLEEIIGVGALNRISLNETAISELQTSVGEAESAISALELWKESAATTIGEHSTTISNIQTTLSQTASQESVTTVSNAVATIKTALAALADIEFDPEHPSLDAVFAAITAIKTAAGTIAAISD